MTGETNHTSIEEVVRRSAANPRRPRLSTETENVLHHIEVDSAACYAGLEHLSEQFQRLAKRIKTNSEQDADDSPDVDDEELESRIDSAKQTAVKVP